MASSSSNETSLVADVMLLVLLDFERPCFGGFRYVVKTADSGEY